jgi:SAM-dependent methyltransferase
VSRRYESVAAETVHGWLVDLLPIAPALVLDVGAGTGRDAAWLASRGLEVVAVEPSSAMRAEAQRLHASPSIRWIRDSSFISRGLPNGSAVRECLSCTHCLVPGSHIPIVKRMAPRTFAPVLQGTADRSS